MRSWPGAIQAVAVLLAGCAAGSASPSPRVAASSAPGHAEWVQGQFRLSLDVPRTVWLTDEAITGGAKLELVETGSTEIGVPAGGPFGFAFSEVNGTRQMEPIFLTSCTLQSIQAGTPLTSGLTKTGAAVGPDASFYAQFLADPLYRLPPGDWDLTAVAMFGPGCGGQTFNARATVRIHVTP